MAKTAFLYTGVTFLVMMTVLIAANYFLLSEHIRYELKSASLEMDIVNNLVSDVRHVTILDPNNALVDAMSDVSFRAIILASGIPSTLKNLLDQNTTVSQTSNTNITKWFLNYTNMTFLDIERYSPLAINFSYPTVNFIDQTTWPKDGPTDMKIIVDYLISISYNLTANSTFETRLTQTLVTNHSLTVSMLNDPLGVYCITVKNADTGLTSFYKEVYCNPTCNPRPITNCP